MKPFILFFSMLVGINMVLLYVVLITTTTALPLVSPSAQHDSFLLAQSPPNAIKGELQQIIGDVSWQSRIATQASTVNQNNIPLTIQQGETVETAEQSVAVLQFQNVLDTTLVENTTIDVIQTLPESFVFLQRQGSTLFQITGKYPVAVRSLHLLFQQHSNGAFRVTTNDNENTISVTVTKGEGEIAYNDLDFVSHTLTLSSNQTLYFDDATRTVSIR